MDELEKLIETSGAVLQGHFKLSSGRHSDTYFEKFRVLENPRVLSAVCRRIAGQFSDAGIELVAGPTTGGIIIAFEIARQLGAEALYVERQDSRRVLRRGASIKQGARTLVVDDVLTTGKSVYEVLDLLRSNGAAIAGVGIMVDRSEADMDFGAPMFAAVRVDAKSYAPEELPERLRQVPVTEPGTRSMK